MVSPSSTSIPLNQSIEADESLSKESRSKTNKTFSRICWSIHQWVGLKLSIFLSFVFLTGTLAVFGYEIDWLINPGMRVDPATVEQTNASIETNTTETNWTDTNWTAIAESISNQYPDAEITYISAPLGPRFAASALIRPADKSIRFIYAHPSTGDIQGDYSDLTVQRVLRFMHRSLMMPTKIGVPLVSSLSILMILSLITSLVVYKKWWRGFFTSLRKRNLRIWMGDFHRLAGVWSLWFVVIISLTSLWYLIESLGGQAPPLPNFSTPTLEWNGEQFAAALPENLSAAVAANPQLTIKQITFPNIISGTFVFQGEYKAILVRARANSVTTDVKTNSVKLTRDGRDLNVHQRISEMADPLHFGDFGGLTTKIIWFAFGLLLTGLSLSGVAIYALRILKKEKTKPSIKRITRISLRGMGLWKWPSIVFVLLSFALLIYFLLSR